MARNTTFYTDVAPRSELVASATLLAVHSSIAIIERWVEQAPIPKKTSRTLKLRRYEELGLATSPLIEGRPPDGTRLTYTDYLATLQQFGDYVEYTDVIVDTHEDPIPQIARERIGQQSAETLETLRWNRLRAGTTVYYGDTSGTDTRVTVDTFTSRSQILEIIRFLDGQKAMKHTKMIKASSRYGTQAIAQAYIAICHTDCKPSWKNLSDFTQVKDYSDSGKVLPAEVGTSEELRVFAGTLYTPFANTGSTDATLMTTGTAGSVACDVYPVMVLAKDCFATVPLRGKESVDIKVVPVNQADSQDRLGQTGSVGWKAWNTSLWTNHSWGARIEVANRITPL